MPELRVYFEISEKDAKAAVIVRPVQGREQHFRTKLEDMRVPQSFRAHEAAGEYHGQKRTCLGGSLQGGTRDRWNQCGRWQGPGCLKGLTGHSRCGRWTHSKTRQKLQHLQVPLPTECEGFVRPARQGSTTMEDVLTHFLGNAITGGPWDAGGDSGAEDIRYGTCMHQRGMPFEGQR
jgi:hypothetical protein